MDISWCITFLEHGVQWNATNL